MMLRKNKSPPELRQEAEYSIVVMRMLLLRGRKRTAITAKAGRCVYVYGCVSDLRQNLDTKAKRRIRGFPGRIFFFLYTAQGLILFIGD